MKPNCHHEQREGSARDRQRKGAQQTRTTNKKSHLAIDGIFASSVSWKAYSVTMATTRKTIVRGLRRGPEDHGEDYEKAAQMLEHFHSLTSSSLNVILEEQDDDGSTRRGMIKTQTCSCLTAWQKSTERKSTTSSISSQDGMEDDEEWGYFSDPLPERPATPVRDPPTNFHDHHSAKRGKL